MKYEAIILYKKTKVFFKNSWNEITRLYKEIEDGWIFVTNNLVTNILVINNLVTNILVTNNLVT